MIIVFLVIFSFVLMFFMLKEKFTDVLGAQSSIDCLKFPSSPACKPVPSIPTTKEFDTCVPADGIWTQTGSKLLSPCCQPPKYSVSKTMKTCEDNLDTSNVMDNCIKVCCDNAESEARNYDASWYPMAKCACSLWCNNQDVVHFKKYGTATHYITGDIAEAKTSDAANFIGSNTISGYV